VAISIPQSGLWQQTRKRESGFTKSLDSASKPALSAAERVRNDNHRIKFDRLIIAKKKAGIFTTPAFVRQFTNTLHTYELLPHSNQDIKKKRTTLFKYNYNSLHNNCKHFLGFFSIFPNFLFKSFQIAHFWPFKCQFSALSIGCNVNNKKT